MTLTSFSTLLKSTNVVTTQTSTRPKNYLWMRRTFFPSMSNISLRSGDLTDKLLLEKETPVYVILSIENLAAIIGNTFLLLSFIKATGCRSNMYIIIQSLGVVDILAALSASVHFVLLIIDEITTQVEVCRYGIICHTSLALCNSFHLLLMCIDRYVAIAFPHR